MCVCVHIYIYIYIASTLSMLRSIPRATFNMSLHVYELCFSNIHIVVDLYWLELHWY